jgi:hypothetical protein
VVGHSRYWTYLPEAIRTYLAGASSQVAARLKELQALLDKHTLYKMPSGSMRVGDETWLLMKSGC